MRAPESCISQGPLRCAAAAPRGRDKMEWRDLLHKSVSQGCVMGPVSVAGLVWWRGRLQQWPRWLRAPPTIASVHAGSTGPLGMYLVIPVRALCSLESLILTSGRHVRHTRCTARGKCVHLHVQHPHTPRAARRAQLSQVYFALGRVWSPLATSKYTVPRTLSLRGNGGESCCCRWPKEAGQHPG